MPEAPGTTHASYTDQLSGGDGRVETKDKKTKQPKKTEKQPQNLLRTQKRVVICS